MPATSYCPIVCLSLCICICVFLFLYYFCGFDIARAIPSSPKLLHDACDLLLPIIFLSMCIFICVFVFLCMFLILPAQYHLLQNYCPMPATSLLPFVFLSLYICICIFLYFIFGFDTLFVKDCLLSTIPISFSDFQFLQALQGAQLVCNLWYHISKW